MALGAVKGLYDRSIGDEDNTLLQQLSFTAGFLA